MADKGSVVVTGAGSGIGLAVATRLVADGWPVAMLDRDEGALDRARNGFPPGAVATCALDVTDPDAVADAIATAAKAGPIAGLVNSAGIGANVPFAETEVAAFRRILDINVIGSFLTAREAAPHMAATGGGSIVHIASVSGMMGNPGRTAYGASKGAVITMTKVMAVELAVDGIRVNAVAPGPVDTPMVEAMHPPSERRNWNAHLPMRRYGTPAEIAAAVAFLIDGTQSGYVTGQILAVDGGFTAGGTLPVPMRFAEPD